MSTAPSKQIKPAVEQGQLAACAESAKHGFAAIAAAESEEAEARRLYGAKAEQCNGEAAEIEKLEQHVDVDDESQLIRLATLQLGAWRRAWARNNTAASASKAMQQVKCRLLKNTWLNPSWFFS